MIDAVIAPVPSIDECCPEPQLHVWRLGECQTSEKTGTYYCSWLQRYNSAFPRLRHTPNASLDTTCMYLDETLETSVWEDLISNKEMILEERTLGVSLLLNLMMTHLQVKLHVEIHVC